MHHQTLQPSSNGAHHMSTAGLITQQALPGSFPRLRGRKHWRYMAMRSAALHVRPERLSQRMMNRATSAQLQPQAQFASRVRREL
jgi:hypothetical protein